METARFKNMMKSVETALSAATFAEEGETATARAILHQGRGILLALKEGRIDARTLKYAFNAAQRIGAHLDILYVASGDDPEREVEPVLRAFEASLAGQGIRSRLVRKTGCLKQQIIDYTNKEKEIQFAVIESSGSLEADCNKKDRTLSDLWQKLKCPLVVVMEQAS